MKLSILLIFLFSITACGGSGGTTGTTGTGGSSSGNTIGTITLSGVDTATTGAQLNTGFIGSSLAAGLQPDYIIIVDSASTVTFTPPNVLTPNIADANNAFVLVVTDDSSVSGSTAISMSIVVNGTRFDYACSNPVSVFTDCGAGAITLDIANKTVVLNNVKTINVDTAAVFTLDGTLTW